MDREKDDRAFTDMFSTYLQLPEDYLKRKKEIEDFEDYFQPTRIQRVELSEDVHYMKIRKIHSSKFTCPKCVKYCYTSAREDGTPKPYSSLRPVHDKTAPWNYVCMLCEHKFVLIHSTHGIF